MHRGRVAGLFGSSEQGLMDRKTGIDIPLYSAIYLITIAQSNPLANSCCISLVILLRQRRVRLIPDRQRLDLVTG